MRVLFSDVIENRGRAPGQQHTPAFRMKSQVNNVLFGLTRNDIVALLQSFGRFSSSIAEVAEFRRILDT